MIRSVKRRVLTCVCLVVAAGMVDAAESGTFQTALDNGLTVLLKENHAAPVATIRVLVRTGSMFEQEYLGYGISHVFEHLLHGGTTTTRTEEECEKILDSIGGSTNAYTTRNATVYHISTASRYLDTAIELIADWTKNSTFPEAAFKREMGVVQREAERGDDSPVRVLHKLHAETMFQVHPVRYPVIGYRSLIAKITREDILGYYKRMYVPNNMVVVAVGDFVTDDVLAKIKAAFGPMERRAVPAIAFPEEPGQLGLRYAEREMDVKMGYLLMGFRTVPLSHPDLYPLDVLSYILSNGESSRLVRQVKDEKQLVHGIRSWSHTPSYDAGVFGIRASLDDENVQAARDAIWAELDRVKNDYVSRKELQKAKRQKVSSQIFQNQTVEAQAEDLGWNLLEAGDPDFTERYVKNIQPVTRQQVREVARKYLRRENLTVCLVKPRVAEPSVAREKAMVSDTKIRKEVLPNGLTVLLKRNPNVPIVSMQAYFLGGVRYETEETNGICSLVASLLTKGTRKRTAMEIAEAFDSMGGSVGGGSGNNTLYCSASMLSDDLERGLEIFADVVMNPVFHAEELEKARNLTLAAIKARNDHPMAEASHEFRKTIFKVSPYRLDSVGEIESVSKLTREQLLEFHRAYVVPNNGVLAVFGDLEPDAALAAIQDAFKRFEAAESVKRPNVPVEPPLKEDVKRLVATQKKTAVVYLGYSGMALTDGKDRYPMLLLDAITSGVHMPGGWLHTELRGKQLVYVVHAYNWMGIDPGYFGIYAMAQPEKADEVAEIILKNMAKARGGEFSDEEMGKAKKVCITTELLGRQTNADLAAQAALDELYGLGYDYSLGFADRVNAVTKEEVKRVAQKYLTKHALLIARPELPKPTKKQKQPQPQEKK